MLYDDKNEKFSFRKYACNFFWRFMLLNSSMERLHHINFITVNFPLRGHDLWQCFIRLIERKRIYHLAATSNSSIFDLTIALKEVFFLIQTEINLFLRKCHAQNNILFVNWRSLPYLLEYVCYNMVSLDVNQIRTERGNLKDQTCQCSFIMFGSDKRMSFVKKHKGQRAPKARILDLKNGRSVRKRRLSKE